MTIIQVMEPGMGGMKGSMGWFMQVKCTERRSGGARAWWLASAHLVTTSSKCKRFGPMCQAEGPGCLRCESRYGTGM